MECVGRPEVEVERPTAAVQHHPDASLTPVTLSSRVLPGTTPTRHTFLTGAPRNHAHTSHFPHLCCRMMPVHRFVLMLNRRAVLSNDPVITFRPSVLNAMEVRPAVRRARAWGAVMAGACSDKPWHGCELGGCGVLKAIKMRPTVKRAHAWGPAQQLKGTAVRGHSSLRARKKVPLTPLLHRSHTALTPLPHRSHTALTAHDSDKADSVRRLAGGVGCGWPCQPVRTVATSHT
eukprot:218336-Chlamydomonas_euryale.AAC.3